MPVRSMPALSQLMPEPQFAQVDFFFDLFILFIVKHQPEGKIKDYRVQKWMSRKLALNI